MKRIICRHCNKVRYPKQRGLCWTCAQTPSIRERYPSTSKFAKRGVQDTYGGLRVPDQPTDAPAGSLEKLSVLIERASTGRRLWHPKDCKYMLEPTAETRAKRARGPREATRFTYKGKTQSLLQWSHDLKIPVRSLCARLQRGWSIYKALSTPPGKYKKCRRS